MKNLLGTVIIVWIFSSCQQQPTLSHEEASQLIRTENKYPQAYTIDLNRLDPLAARMLKEKKLDSLGLLSFKESYTMQEEGKTPLVYFAEKAKPFILPAQPGQDTTAEVTVKVADLDLLNDLTINTDGNMATVAYKNGYTNLTPFKALIKRDLSKDIKGGTAHFTYVNGKWILDK